MEPYFQFIPNDLIGRYEFLVIITPSKFLQIHFFLNGMSLYLLCAVFTLGRMTY